MELFILNTDYEMVAVIDEYESLIWTDRYNAYGDFEVVLAMDNKLLDIFKEDYYIRIKDSEHCMIIENIQIDSDVENGNRLTVTGRSLESILDRRIIWGQEYISGKLHDLIHMILKRAIIEPEQTNPALIGRKIENFIFTETDDSQVLEKVTEHQYTGDNLYDVIQGLCDESNIGFKIILNDDNEFEFSLYAGTDRSYNQSVNPYVVFSPKFDNIINSNYYQSKTNLKNVTLVMGEGEGSARKRVTVGSATGLKRREVFTDARDISSETEDGTISHIGEYMNLLRARGQKKLSENTVIKAFEGEVEAKTLFKYGEDFFIGDIVQISNEYGHEGTAYISEIVISVNRDEHAIYPTFKTIEI